VGKSHDIPFFLFSAGNCQEVKKIPFFLNMESVELNKTRRFSLLAPVGYPSFPSSCEPLGNHGTEGDEPHQTNLEAKMFFDDIFPGDSYELASKSSANERKLLATSRKNFTLTYGEILYDSFTEILSSALLLLEEQDTRDMIFIDLGSGTGKASFITALNSSNFESCFGVEIMPSLHTLALQSLASWKEQQKRLPPSSSLSAHPTTIEFLHGSFLDLDFFDWTIGDLVFANSTCYGQEIMVEISKHSGLDFQIDLLHTLSSAFSTASLFPQSE
jgi:hypothetical protein